MGYYLDTFFEKEFNPYIERCRKREQERQERERQKKERRGILDETGCMRYTMTLDDLQALYKRFEDFIADCTQQEYNENKSAIIAVYTLLHKHINAETMK